jgi:hypothetical protein
VLAKRNGAIVYFDVGDKGINIPTIEQLRQRLPLTPVAEYDNGSIWRLARSTP